MVEGGGGDTVSLGLLGGDLAVMDEAYDKAFEGAYLEAAGGAVASLELVDGDGDWEEAEAGGACFGGGGYVSLLLHFSVFFTPTKLRAFVEIRKPEKSALAVFLSFARAAGVTIVCVSGDFN